MSLVDPNAPDDAIWDSETGETFGEARKRFATFGDEVPWQIVPDLVRAGSLVWSFGYGDDPKEFTVITDDDLWAWGDLSEVEGPGVVNSWAPFRVESLTHGTYDPDDDSTKTPERGYDGGTLT